MDLCSIFVLYLIFQIVSAIKNITFHLFYLIKCLFQSIQSTQRVLFLFFSLSFKLIVSFYFLFCYPYQQRKSPNEKITCSSPARYQAKYCKQQKNRRRERNPNTQADKPNQSRGYDGQQKLVSQTQYQQKYRNKNLDVIPVPLLIAISGLNTLDISYNTLNDSQIELVMNSCTKLVTLCIQGNINTIIPAALWKLKDLVNFKHDWLRLIDEEDGYQSIARLAMLKNLVQKPDSVVKINKIVGMDFSIYSRQVGKITLDYLLIEKAEKAEFAQNVKEDIIKAVRQFESAKSRIKPKVKPVMERDQFIACTVTCGFDNLRQTRQQREKPTSVIQKKSIVIANSKDISEAETDAGSKNIRIQDIRDISEKQLSKSIELNSERSNIKYSSPGMPFHQLLGNFDSSPSASSQIDALLLKGYNPNQYDSSGLSPYHICLIENQRKGFDYLINISINNPGFFDIEMPSHKQYRNILHYSVFLKKYQSTKKLIQFGFPTYKRDSSGSRIIHLVDQNYEFLLLLRKLLKKSTAFVRKIGGISTQQYTKKYVKHPLRVKQESKFRIMYSKHDKLMEMYEEAIGIPHKNT